MMFGSLINDAKRMRVIPDIPPHL